MAGLPVSPNSLVKIASFLDLPHAELARMALAREGIPTAFGNANVVLWFWHYSNAVGGVSLFVRCSQADLARDVLAAARTKIADNLPPWTCPTCGQRVAGQWDACWQCGHFVDGMPIDLPAANTAIPPDVHGPALPWWNVSRVATVVAGVGLALLLLTRGLTPAVWFLPAVFIFVLMLRQFEPSSSEPTEAQGPADANDLPLVDHQTTRSEVSRAIVLRAWQSAVVSLLVFPPLGFYSMKLLWRLGNRDTPLSHADTWRRRAAALFSVISILYCLMFALGLLLSFAMP